MRVLQEKKLMIKKCVGKIILASIIILLGWDDGILIVFLNFSYLLEMHIKIFFR